MGQLAREPGRQVRAARGNQGDGAADAGPRVANARGAVDVGESAALEGEGQEGVGALHHFEAQELQILPGDDPHVEGRDVGIEGDFYGQVADPLTVPAQ